MTCVLVFMFLLSSQWLNQNYH